MDYKISVVTPTIRPGSLWLTQETLAGQTFKDFEWLVEIGFPTRGHDLNAAFNRMIKRAKGELIVFLEDFTKIEPDGLQRFWEAYQKHPDTLMTAPLVKVRSWDDEAKIYDWRTEREDCQWTECELDWGAIPKKVLQEVGGFDEELDAHWSCDNVNLGCRANLAGYKFHCVKDNPALALDHDFIMEHPFRKNYNPAFNNHRMDDFRMGLKINYLK